MNTVKTDMLHGGMWKSILLFALPIAAANLLEQLFNSADTAIVGHFAGSGALAAVGANSPVITLVINTFLGLSIGSNIVMSGATGKGDNDAVSKGLHTSIPTAVLSGLFMFALVMVFAPQVLRLTSVPESIMDQAVLYLRIYSAAMPFIMLYYFEAAIFRSIGDSKTPLITLLIAGILNVGLNFFFVVGLNMSVAGVAAATVISNIFSAAVLFVLLLKRTDACRLEPGKLRISLPVLKKIIRFGVPAGLQGAVFAISNVTVQSAVNSLDTTAIAAVTASMYFDTYSYQIANAFGHAATTFVGQNYGAGKLSRCRGATRICLFWGILIPLSLEIILFIFAPQCLRLFSSDPEVIALATTRMRIIILFVWMNTIDEVLINSMRVYGYTFIPVLLLVVCVCGVRIGAVFTVFRAFPTLEVISCIYPISWITANIAIIIAYIIVMKRMKNGA